MSSNWGFTFAALALLATCALPSPDEDTADTDTDTDTATDTDTDTTSDSSGDSGCSVEGDARIVCAAGTQEESGACTPTEEATVRVTMTCEDYADHGEQVLSIEAGDCATEAGAECCDCQFDLDATCEPCEVND